MRISVRANILKEVRLRCQSLGANNNSGYRQEFEELNDVGKEYSTRAGDLVANREKNRYPLVVPYDHSRVKLSLLDLQPHSDYINASYVPGGCTERDFICTQGPMRSTMADFWRMVCEQNVKIIVMLTALKHKDVVLCDQYWPQERGTVSYGQVQVTTVSCKRGPDYFINTILLRQRGCPGERVITHYHYTLWPDMGVPKDAASLCAFTEHVRQHLDTLPLLGPTVVHCSAGVGRSGTFVTLMWLMQLCMREIRPDVRAAVEDLRRHRVMMVQNLEQYIFVHQCLMHWMSGGTAEPQVSVQSQASAPWGHNHHHTSSKRPSRGNRSKKHRQDTAQHTPQARAQGSVEQLLNPANLLRRLLPASRHNT
ncbi:receptor-type tyrosine-protein phosphatase beta isoform X2 [Esox lucius]|uniref:receptor-type tyrosine-protein phosphatase beta isoform X2 n=1 Tax=Esox lucius TaxID=8010 RepID=UPI0014775B62|nr:receptor-type tyrosine-protein phosphatase beta isoform X2 [Esox lucius]